MNPTLQRPAAGQVPAETRIFTVPAAEADQEIAFRQIFGWRLVNTGARSYATGGTVVGGGLGQSVRVGGGYVSLQNRHDTDLTMTRRLDARGVKLRDLENQYLGIRERSRFKWWHVALLVFVPGAIVTAIIGAIVGDEPGLGKSLQDGFALAIVVLTIVLSIRQARVYKRNAEYNAQAGQLRQQLLAKARQLSGQPAGYA